MLWDWCLHTSELWVCLQWPQRVVWSNIGANQGGLTSCSWFQQLSSRAPRQSRCICGWGDSWGHHIFSYSCGGPARLIRRGWVMWFLVTAEILVLSKYMMVPKRVVPSGSWLCSMSVFHIANKELATHLHLPCYIPSPPLAVDMHQLLWCLEDMQRLKLQCIL